MMAVAAMMLVCLRSNLRLRQGLRLRRWKEGQMAIRLSMIMADYVFSLWSMCVSLNSCPISPSAKNICKTSCCLSKTIDMRDWTSTYVCDIHHVNP